VPRIVPNLWFDTEALEAASFYCGIFPNSEITRVSHYTDAGPGEPGTVLTVDFTLDGQPYTAINGGPQFPFTEAVSFLVACPGQAEVDRYWDALTDGGEGVQCGWLKDRYGLSWQICPDELGTLLGDPDPARARRAAQAMLGMVKLDIAAIRAAADG
jgi:predicted 3-demethylubiquinone-9 3-methyltransferase (glyoxalase superfamily)